MGRRYDTLRQVIAAWQAKDAEGVLAHMAEDVVWHFAAAAVPPARGKAKARKLLARLGGDMHEITWRVFAHAETEDRLFIEGVDDYRTADGHRVATPYAGVLDFRGDLIVGWRDYVDVGVLESQRSGQPMTAQVKELIDRPLAD